MCQDNQKAATAILASADVDEDRSTAVPSSGDDNTPPASTSATSVSELKHRKINGMVASKLEDPNESGTVAAAHNRMLWREKPAEDFSYSKDTEPHVLRRRQIIEKHPEILKLYKPDPLSAVI